ncbi:hypothetical protein PG993_008084 [Apiospora rasikravindrae]|uniref:Uncharacterized protein n=1 Tax=Apiospora rasikravindrae TaxID=990691 RepID=A0ABR1SZB4_9PEZI
MSDEDSSLRSYTTAAETPFESEPLGHAETEARHTDSFPATSYVDLENEVDIFAINNGAGTHGTQPANILSVHGRQFYENFRCPQTDTIETARIEGSPPWKSFVLLTLPPFSRGRPRRGYTCKKEQLGIRSSRFTDLRMLTAQQLRGYIRDHDVPGIHWICPYVDLDPLLNNGRTGYPQRNTYTWMKLDGPEPPFISCGVWNSVLGNQGQGRIDAHYGITGQHLPIEPYPPSATTSFQVDGARLRNQTHLASGVVLTPSTQPAPRQDRVLVTPRTETQEEQQWPLQAPQSQPQPTIERPQSPRPASPFRPAPLTQSPPAATSIPRSDNPTESRNRPPGTADPLEDVRPHWKLYGRRPD